MADGIGPVEFTVPVALASASLILLGALFAARLPRAAGLEPRLRRAVMMVYGVRLLAAALVFALSTLLASAPDSPAAGPGLWRVIPDAIAYHSSGTEQAEAAARGVGLREAGLYPLVVGLAYTHIGRNPLPVILLNGVLDVVTLVLLLVLAGRVLARRPPEWLAWVLGLWPSWIGWSVQPLKEALLLCASVGALVLIVSILPSSSVSRELRRYGVLWWPLLVFVLACIGLLRGADVYIFLVTLALAAAWIVRAALERRVPWRASLASIALIALLPQARAMTERLMAPSTLMERANAWRDVGLIYEKEGAVPRAERAYIAALTFNPDDPVARERLGSVRGRESATTGLGALAPPAGVPPPAEPSSAPGRLSRALERVNLQTLADMRSHLTTTTDPGDTRFGQDADVSTAAGLLRFLPVAVVHVLFAPFPGLIFSSDEAAHPFRLASLVELPWMYAIAVLGFLGAWVRCRSGGVEGLLVAAYVTLGVLALALIVDHDGLLFRYRLQFMVPLAVFLPAALEVRPIRAVVTRVRRRAVTGSES